MTARTTRIAAVAIGLAATATLAAAGVAWRGRPKPAEEIVVAWRPLGSWSGYGNTQTESFISDTGFLRVKWKTVDRANPEPGSVASRQTPDSARASATSFRATFHSAVSGRPIALAVETRGAGTDAALVQEDPRTYYVVVESSGLDWSFTVEEGVAGVVKGRR